MTTKTKAPKPKKNIVIEPATWEWIVFVEASGGWIPMGAFVNEADAWEFGEKHFRARVYERHAGLAPVAAYECLGEKEGFRRCWGPPKPD